MTVTDTRFGGEFITAKGRILRFDDIHCMRGYLSAGSLNKNDIASTWLADYSAAGKLIEKQEAVLFRSETLRSPMGSNIAAFPSEQSAKNLVTDLKGSIVDWTEVFP
jgi:copper chaperone NosL